VRPSWFVALPVAAGSWFERVQELPAGVRRFHPEDLHLTVAFLGGVEADAARRAFEVAGQIRLAPLEVTLGDVVPMGNPQRPSALSGRLVVGEQLLAAAITEVRDAIFAAAGVPREQRPALPHITLARPGRTASDAERSEALRWAASLELGGPRVRLTELALYTWSEARRERLFQVVERLPLRGLVAQP